MNTEAILQWIAAIAGVCLASFVAWLFKSGIGDSLKAIRTHMEMQIAHNSAHEQQTKHIIQRVDELHERIFQVEEKQERNTWRFSRIMSKLDLDD